MQLISHVVVAGRTTIGSASPFIHSRRSSSSRSVSLGRKRPGIEPDEASPVVESPHSPIEASRVWVALYFQGYRSGIARRGRVRNGFEVGNQRSACEPSMLYRLNGAVLLADQSNKCAPSIVHLEVRGDFPYARHERVRLVSAPS
jgi:hypothetical protein